MENTLFDIILFFLMAYAQTTTGQAGQFTECLKGFNLENVKPEKMTSDQRKSYDNCRQLALVRPQ